MNIKEKIEEMERIAGEIEEDLEVKGIYLLFSWSITVQGSPIDRVLRRQDDKVEQIRQELYRELAEAGVLPRKDGPADETAPDQG